MAPKVTGSFVPKYYCNMQQEMKDAKDGHRRFECGVFRLKYAHVRVLRMEVLRIINKK
jgi:hypothetical protein